MLAQKVVGEGKLSLHLVVGRPRDRDATRLGIVTGYAEVSPGRIALTMGPGFTSASTVEYHLKRIYSAYGDYLNHTLAPVLELHANGAVIGDYTWEGLALSQKVGQGS